MTGHVLVLGSGRVSPSLVHYLLEQPDLRVSVASRTIEKAVEIVAGHPHGQAIAVDVTDSQALDGLIAGCDVVVSLLPQACHLDIASLCLQHKKHLITTSYVSDAMRELDGAARRAGVLFLNEVGLDPGIDHMSAMRIIHEVQRTGGTILHFSSYCGGLPAPDSNNNPFGYKFSWSPREALLAGKTPARYLRGGQTVEVSVESLFDTCWAVAIQEIGDFEGYPNRDSLPYLGLYGLKGARGIFRGTLRNHGWCATLKRISELGLLNEERFVEPLPQTWIELTSVRIGRVEHHSIREAVAEYLEIETDSPELDRLVWLGIFEDTPLPTGVESPLDALVTLMRERLKYMAGEKDMVILKHEFFVEYPDHMEEIACTLVEYGVPGGDSAMARTVGLPAAMCTARLLRGEITGRGVQIPVSREIYEPVLQELAAHDIMFLEEHVTFC